MAWIKIIEREEASSELVEAYEKVAGERGRVANILKVHSVNPRTMLAHLGLYKECSAIGADEERAGNDRRRGVGYQPLPLLNRASRRGSP